MLTRLAKARQIERGARLLRGEGPSILFVTSLLRAREIKMASALRRIGWKVVLVYVETTPFPPGEHFDLAIRARSESQAHALAKALSPKICHVFSGAVDGLVTRFCGDKPAPVVIDLNDVFCPSLFNYCQERFEPTRECLREATAFCARDLQGRQAERLDGFRLPRHTIFFPEYSWCDGPHQPAAAPKHDPAEVHVVSVGTFCLETLGMYDSAYLQLARMLAEREIHLHIYPHWFYRKSRGSAFNLDLAKDFADFLRLQQDTPYLHVHDSLSLDELARELPQHDFGLISGASPALGQRLQLLTQEYMESCYSGRISDYLDARLPVLINREVGFNYRLLRHYGLTVDLGGIHQPGFRERLLAIKHDRAQATRVEQASQTLSLDGNIARLAAFYDRILHEEADARVRWDYPLSVARSLPILGAPLRRMDTAVERINRSVEQLRTELRAERQQDRRRQRLLDRTLEELRTESARAHALAETAHALAETLHAIFGQGERRTLANAAQRLEVELGPTWADELSGLLNWPEIRDPAEQTAGMPELLEMIRVFASHPDPLNELSACWQVLAFKNFNQLLRDGYRRFKRTLACNYFTFLVQDDDPQIAYLEAQLAPGQCVRLREMAVALPDDPHFPWRNQRAYRYLVLLLWAYTQTVDVLGHLQRLEEPPEGDPLTVPVEGRRASQDLANSLLEYYSMAEVVRFDACTRVLEIGGGYGRNAYVMLALHPHLQYTFVDVPPALWVAQRYLSSVFPDRRVFRAREFQHYDDVRDEMRDASIVFLLPHQLELLPAGSFDLSLNISSFGEMLPKQITAYLEAIGRLTRGHLYLKQWKVSQNAFDHVVLTEDSYAPGPDWQLEYSRPCRVQTAFFEALYRLPGPRP